MITELANEAIITILEYFRNYSGEKELEPELSMALRTLETKIQKIFLFSVLIIQNVLFLQSEIQADKTQRF